MIDRIWIGDVFMAAGKNMYAKPFLRWAGGKSWLVKHLAPILGDRKFCRYHEPFLGGGSIFFYMAPKEKSYLSDLNGELIDTYKAIKEDPDGVISCLEEYVNTSEEYYRIRSLCPTTLVETAARFIYLNQTSFNGIYRVNIKGEYNVPYGNRTKISWKLTNCARHQKLYNRLHYKQGILIALEHILVLETWFF